MPFLPKRPRPRGPRRGVTLVEMLVAVALLVLMMTIIVQVFAAATGAVSAAKTYQDLDSGLRQLDTVIRQDLKNISATLTPPLNPSDNKGYFEYGENSFADLQGEDTDDYLRFTVWAPEGQYFTGRLFVNPPANVVTAINGGGSPAYLLSTQPITITSQCAEIIYFLRNGNLYRRVLLVAPERQSSISQLPASITAFGNGSYYASSSLLSSGPPPPPPGTPLPLSWQGVNDLSTRSTMIPANAATNTPPTALLIPNTLGDLTNRENRYAYSRFMNDYVTNPIKANLSAVHPDGIPDDENLDVNGNIIGDGIHDYYTSLYPGIFAPANGGLVWETSNAQRNLFNMAPQELLAFPYVFPGAYSRPDLVSDQNGIGWIHSPRPDLDVTTISQSTAVALANLNALNHNPLDLGDSLPVPGATATTAFQTWWGFPTWRETLSSFWNDPTFNISGFPLYPVPATQVAPGQPNFLHPYVPGTASAGGFPTLLGVNGSKLLPPMTGTYQPVPPFFNDGAGEATLASTPLWQVSWEDDLIMSGVRSFDVKAYDNSFPGYVDLGWGDDLRITQAATTQFIAQTPATLTWAGSTNLTLTQTYAHEGRIPPLHSDLRFDNTYGFNPTGLFINGGGAPFKHNGIIYDGNVGDDKKNVVRLRRVWDTWSTDYANAPSTGYDPTTFAPIGPPYSPPVYPSFPAPYPMPLRGLQIQIRVVDPSNQRIKVLTIRQDFSDKLQ